MKYKLQVAHIFLFIIIVASIASVACAAYSSPQNGPIDLSGMEVGDIYYGDGIAIQRVSSSNQTDVNSVLSENINERYNIINSQADNKKESSAIEKVSEYNDNCIDYQEESRTTTKGYSVTFSGEEDDNETLHLSNTYRYWYIYINNQNASNSLKWMITVGNNSSTQSNNFYTVDPGIFYIWSTTQWAAVDTMVSYTCGQGLYGNSSARLCSTLNEAVSHGT